ncbi:unnamed protein product [Miscanthus lutarioriparius]|uniref:Uncharacterized protein n=1 Tax=Miscanthus lutarioriparius TaxID=422564 RepID=A0A811P0A6_9POAL|nr:unnamed protein product [Miscanthus lutarioriparius]
MDNDTYAFVASQDVEVIVHQNLCENESHIAKLRESENKSELRDSTHCDVESINNASVRDTPQKDRELECKSSEDIFETNILISTSSVVFPNKQDCNENNEDMAAHDNSILVERSEKVDIHPNQLCAAQNMNHDEESVIERNQSLCADLTESHVVRSVEFYLDESLCALNDPCNTSYTNKLHLV